MNKLICGLAMALGISLSCHAQGMKISQYPNTNNLAGTNLFLIAIVGSPGTNMNISYAQLSNLLVAAIGGGGGAQVWTNDTIFASIIDTNITVYLRGGDISYESIIMVDKASADTNITAFQYPTTFASIVIGHTAFITPGQSQPILANLFDTVAIGTEVLQVCTNSFEDTFIGHKAGLAWTNSAENVAVGYYAGSTTTIGAYNCFLGAEAGYGGGGTNNNCVGIGYRSLYGIKDVDDLTAVGYNSLNSVTTGSRNTGIGWNAGSSVTTGKANTFLGHAADGTSTVTNSTAIGAYATVSANNQIMLGNTAVRTVATKGTNFVIGCTDGIGSWFVGILPDGTMTTRTNTSP